MATPADAFDLLDPGDPQSNRLRQRVHHFQARLAILAAFLDRLGPSRTCGNHQRPSPPPPFSQAAFPEINTAITRSNATSLATKTYESFARKGENDDHRRHGGPTACDRIDPGPSRAQRPSSEIDRVSRSLESSSRFAALNRALCDILWRVFCGGTTFGGGRDVFCSPTLRVRPVGGKPMRKAIGGAALS